MTPTRAAEWIVDGLTEIACGLYVSSEQLTRAGRMVDHAGAELRARAVEDADLSALDDADTQIAEFVKFIGKVQTSVRAMRAALRPAGRGES